jgi:hypothetical protein
VHMTTSLCLVIYDIDESLQHSLLMDWPLNHWTAYLRCSLQGHVDVSCPGSAARSLSQIMSLHIDSNFSSPLHSARLLVLQNHLCI